MMCLSCPMVKTPACRAGNPGSIPGWGVKLLVRPSTTFKNDTVYNKVCKNLILMGK